MFDLLYLEDATLPSKDQIIKSYEGELSNTHGLAIAEEPIWTPDH